MRNWKPFKGNFDNLSVIGNLLRVVLTRFLLDNLNSYGRVYLEQVQVKKKTLTRFLFEELSVGVFILVVGTDISGGKGEAIMVNSASY
jgi:hypothetical protein